MKRPKKNQQLNLFEPTPSAPTRKTKPGILGRSVNHTWTKPKETDDA